MAGIFADTKGGATMIRHACLGLSFLLALTGCPHDKLHSPRLRNDLDFPVQMRFVLQDGSIIDDGAELAPGTALVWGYRPEQIVSVSLLLDGEAIIEIDAERMTKMLGCTSDPRDVTWYIQSDGLRPSVPCDAMPPGR